MVSDSKYNIDIVTTQSGDGFEKVNKATRESAEGFKLWGRGAHEAHAAVDALAAAFPALNGFASFMFGPVPAAIGAATLIFDKFNDSAKECMKALDALSDPGVRGLWMEKQREALEKAYVAAQLFEKQIARVAIQQASLSQVTDEVVRRLSEQNAAETDIKKAQEGLDSQYIDYQQATGKLTPTQAAAAHLALSKQDFKDQTEARQRDLENELKARQAEQAGYNKNMAGLHTDAHSKQAAADAAEQAQLHNAGKLDQDKKSLEESQKRAEAAQRIIEELDGKGAWGGKWDRTDPQYYELDSARRSQESEATYQANVRRSIKQEEEKQKGLDVGAGSTKADADEAKKKYEDATKNVNDLNLKIEQLQSSLKTEQSKNVALEQAHQDQSDPNYLQNRTARDAAAKESGPSAQIDSFQTLGAARNLEAQVTQHLRSRTGTPDDLAQIHAAISRMAGLISNHLVGDGNRRDMQAIMDRLNRLESALDAEWHQTALGSQ